MKKTLLLLLLTVAGLVAQAQIPNGYYNSANGKTGDELRSALHEIIKDHTTISYQQIWNAFWSTDNKGNNVVWDMYSDGATYTYSYMGGNDQCGEYEQEGDCYNREHSWPKSWFAGNEQTIPGRDLHHIFPTDGYVNAQRGNFPFGEVGSGTVTTFQNGSKLGNCKSTLGYTGTVFEPIDEYKGDFARAYFYMSTRYYGEDSDWGTSGMTNKADIKSWAINMLLRWSDADPVSQKEIDRNNAVFGIQGNRNPFIDHPEYAHIIWEPGWTGVTYNITTASVQHGSISAPATAVEGTMVTLTATPAQGYMLGSWSVYKTGDTSTTVAVSSNGTFTMPSFNVTVSATFVQNNTQYSITCATGLAHGSISTNVSSTTSGTTVTLSNTPANGYVLYSYYVYKTGDLNTIVYSGTGNNFTMPAFDVTVSASFVQPSSYSYVKVTSAPADWSGFYLIVYESDSKAFDGSLTTLDAENNIIAVTINSGKIASSSTVDASKFTIDKSGTNNYTIKSASGYYIGKSSNGNGLQTSQTTAYTNTISYNSTDNSIDIKSSNNLYLRFNNNTSNGNRFRYYSSGQQPIQLYKKTSSATTPTHTIHFDKNGGSGTMNDQTVNEFEPTALQANAFTYGGHAFNCWNTESDGSGTSYFNGAIVTLLNDLTLYAQWQPLYNVSLTAPGNGNNINASASQAVEGEIVTLTATPATGYEFDCWNVTAGEQTISVTDNSFEMPAANVSVSATFTYVGTFDQKYYLVTSTDQLVADRTYLIVCTSKSKALGSTQNTNNRSAADVTISNDIITSMSTTVCELTLGGNTDAWTFKDGSNGYLYAAGNGNYLRTETTLSDRSKWTISIDNGTATIVSNGETNQNQIRYNNSSNIFSCYASTANVSQMPLVSLFVLSKEIEHPTNETIPHLFSFDKHVINRGVTLTVTGTATCNNPSHLIIEEGGQLIHHSDGVQATVKRTIQAYTADDNGWYTVAMPFITTYNPANTPLTTSNYDLFAYDESATGAEWRNYKAASFNLATGHGYLYAHNPTTTLRMTGTLNNGDYSNTIDLGYDNNNADIRGFNLLGNPTAHDINFTKTVQVSDGYYYVENGSSLTYVASNTVPAGRGFFVKANDTGQKVTLNSNSKRDNSETIASLLQIDVDGEQAYVKLTEGVSMPLLDFRGHQSNVYLTKEGKNYIMLVRDNADAIDLCYQPSTGTHTLSVKAENLDYLHLIDHLTGNNIDLLANPSYSFESGVKDYTSRFQLLFSPKANDDVYGDSFVDGKTVIIDMTGRVVATDRHAKLAPGIYLLRTVNGNEVKTKKIFIN